MIKTTLGVVLAAGEGTRMKSARPKVLHALAGRSLLAHALTSLKSAGLDHAAVVVGPGHDSVAAEALNIIPDAGIFVQEMRRGTGHAVLQARNAIGAGHAAVVVMFGDTPLVRPETIRKLADAVLAGAGVAAMGFEAKDPFGYGRFLTNASGELLAIREQKDATEAERKVTLCSGGLLGLSGLHALAILDAIGCDNAQNEYYLTEAVESARKLGLKTVPVIVPEEEAFGVNDRAQLASAESVVQGRLRRAALLGGVTMQDPASVYLSMDTRFARDVTIEPHVVFGNHVSVEEGVVIHAFSHLEGSAKEAVIVRAGASIGPYARLRPGADIGAKARVGNFVEIKNAMVETGAKINHLSYVGDARVGVNANVGAGTITCNYDGFRKSRTDIGAGAFIGSNSALVAPVKIGDGAIIGAGSVITRDVPADSLTLERSKQISMDDWAKAFRAKPENQKKKP